MTLSRSWVTLCCPFGLVDGNKEGLSFGGTESTCENVVRGTCVRKLFFNLHALLFSFMLAQMALCFEEIYLQKIGDFEFTEICGGCSRQAGMPCIATDYRVTGVSLKLGIFTHPEGGDSAEKRIRVTPVEAGEKGGL